MKANMHLNVERFFSSSQMHFLLLCLTLLNLFSECVMFTLSKTFQTQDSSTCTKSAADIFGILWKVLGLYQNMKHISVGLNNFSLHYMHLLWLVTGIVDIYFFTFISFWCGTTVIIWPRCVSLSEMCCILNFFADVLVHGSLSKQSVSWMCLWVCVCLRVSTGCVWIFVSQTRCSRCFLLVSWCPLISWCCRGFQNGASGSGISFHCHDNDSDTLAPSSTQTSHCMETGMQFLLQRQPTILCESERSLNDSPFRRGWGASSQLKWEQQNSAILKTQGCSLNTHIKQYQGTHTHTHTHAH